MKVEILYFDGCPNHSATNELVRDVLREEGVSANVSEVNVHNPADARQLGFLGSPTVRVDGVDVEPAVRSSRECGMMCRTYAVNGRSEGIPPREMIRQAIRDRHSEQTTNRA